MVSHTLLSIIVKILVQKVAFEAVEQVVEDYWVEMQISGWFSDPNPGQADANTVSVFDYR